jgi:hypothetical protein
MEKLKLEMDSLVVESFATGHASTSSGTVRGRLGADEGDMAIMAPVPKTADVTCPATCKFTCANTCDYTCGDTCYITCVTACSCITLPCAGCA